IVQSRMVAQDRESHFLPRLQPVIPGETVYQGSTPNGMGYGRVIPALMGGLQIRLKLRVVLAQVVQEAEEVKHVSHPERLREGAGRLGHTDEMISKRLPMPRPTGRVCEVVCQASRQCRGSASACPGAPRY